MIDIKPLRTEENYLQAVKTLEDNLHKSLQQEDAEKLEVLAILVNDWDRAHKPNDRGIVEETGDMNYVYQLVSNASNSVNVGSLTEKCLKLNEEVGELSAEVLKMSNYKKSDLSKSEVRDRIVEEAVDSLVMVIDILTTVNATNQEITDATEDAVNKWLSYQ